MAKLASTFMTEQQFWQIIENSNKGENLTTELHKLTEDEIFGYRYWWEYFCRQSYTQSLWAVAYTVMGGCGDDGFDYFRFWIVTRGETVYKNALANADSLCDTFDDCDYPEFEEADYAPWEVFEEKFGKNPYDAEADYDLGDKTLLEIKFEWHEDDEASIRKVCPKTFDKWWHNDKF